MSAKWHLLVAVALLLVPVPKGTAQEASQLRLVPFPKEVKLRPGSFALDRSLVLELPRDQSELLGQVLADELHRAGLPKPATRPLDGARHRLVLATGAAAELPGTTFAADDPEEKYALVIGPDAVVAEGAGEAGLFYAAQTLVQLIRANRRDASLPCLAVRDWPSLRWRCFQDDMTRGPSSTLATLRREVEIGAGLKMNLFTYYMEYQYAFRKHPIIGPENGSLEPDDLRALVEHAAARHVDVLGNQQSFGHFSRILQHDEFAALRETPSLLTPVREETYKLLDDMYSEVCPILPFPWLNVCCDETWGLGTGPSKELAEKIGVGGVYVGHIRRLHDLLRDKHHKRMMMWGDIILQHPEHLDQVPKDTIMLTWGYGPRASFEGQIVPFANSGYEFFVCPGISNWSRILPDFGVATANIHAFVRDGAKHGALGMLNTAWEDDGEALQGYKWHGYAWGAECAWNASATTPEDFNRRIGAVLFGERGDHFGRAIELLAETHRLAGMNGMNNRRFWENDFAPRRGEATIHSSSQRLLELVQPAIEHLEACRKDATVNADLLDRFLFGARRMELIATRMRDGLEAAKVYADACDRPPEEAASLVEKAIALARTNRDAHAALGKEFERLWLEESKPYALDWTLDRYAAVVAWYDGLLAELEEARQAVEADRPLPPPGAVGLAMPEDFARRTRPNRRVAEPLEPDAPWAVPDATHRLGLVVEAGPAERHELPVEVDVALPEVRPVGQAASLPVRAFCRIGDGPPQEILAQLDPADMPDRARLTVLIPGPIPQGGRAVVHVYLGLPAPPPPLAGAVSTSDADRGMKWIENDKVRLLLGPEGAHVYRWEAKALEGRDLTMPGTEGWAGFSDMAHGHRSTPHTLECIARGPALVRYRATDPSGLVKTVSLFGGASWMEVVLNEATGHYWDFDNPANFAGDGPTPGEYLFSDGTTGPVGRQADGVPAQVKRPNVRWGVKSGDRQLAVGLVTPEVAALHVIAPGAGAGGVGIERSPEALHFITYAGLLEAEPAETMDRLRRTLDFRRQPEVAVFAVQARPAAGAESSH